MIPGIFEPKLFDMGKRPYSWNLFGQDLMAGLIVGIVALPLAIAFAIASGVSPERGLYTAVVAGFIISAFGGSRVQIGGPTGAFIVIVFGIVQKFGYEGLVIATILAGVMLIILGAVKMGDVIKFIPYPVTVGFTTGIAVVIFSTQVWDFFGIRIAEIPSAFLSKWGLFFMSLGQTNGYALLTGVLALGLIVGMPKITKKIPGSIVAIIVTTILVHWLKWPVETIFDRFGNIPNSLPMPQFPQWNWALITQMFPSAFTIAMLAGIESLLSAVVADGMTGHRHRSNTELIAQGIANIFSPLFGGIPATGAIARTATNIRNGATTPVAGLTHALTLFLILIFFGRYAVLIPLPALAAVLIAVAYHMSEYRFFIRLFRSPKSDVIVLLITFLLTILVDLTVAINAGVVLAAFLFMKRMTDVTQFSYVQEMKASDLDEELREKCIPQGIEVFEINGPFFFGAADKFKDTLRQIDRPKQILILRMRHVPSMDATGLKALEGVVEQSMADGEVVVLSGVRPQPLDVIRQSGLAEKIGEENIHTDFDDALSRAKVLLERKDLLDIILTRMCRKT